MSAQQQVRQSVLAAAEEGLAYNRQRARVRYHLRKHALRLVECRNGHAVMDHGRVRFASPSLDEIEAWARSEAA